MNTQDYLRQRLMAAVYHGLTAGELFGLARSGDPEAFVALVCRRFGMVAAVCRERLGPAGPVEDITLDVFLDLWRHRTAVTDPAAVDGWLARTAARRATRWLAREAARRVRESARDDPPPVPDPARTAEAGELAALVRRAVAELSAADRQMLAAADVADADATAAAGLGLTVPAYRTRLHRARERLRNVLERYGLGPLLGLVWTAAAAAGRKKALAAVVAVAAVTVVGVWWGAPTPPADPPPSTPPPAGTPETVPDRHLRVFHSDVLPAVIAALRPAALGSGSVELVAAEAYDTRVDCTLDIRHRAEGVADWATRVRFVRDVDGGETLAFAILDRAGHVRRIDPTRPIVLWKNPVTGAEVVVPVEPVVRAIAEFDRIPRDARTAAEAAANRARVRAAVARYAGRWRFGRNPGAEAVVEIRGDRPRFAFTPGVGREWYEFSGYEWLRVTSDGRLHGLYLFDSAAVFADDGRRIDFPQTGDRWDREPGGD